MKKFIFIFVFSFTIILGSLIKEPNYARSSICIAILLFSTLPITRKQNEK